MELNKNLENSKELFPDGIEVMFTLDGLTLKKSGHNFIYLKYEEVPDLARALLVIYEEGL